MQCDIIAIDFRFGLDADFDSATGCGFGSTCDFGFDRDHETAWAGFDVLRRSAFAPLENARGQGPK